MSIPAGATHVVADIYSLRDEQKVMNNKYPYRKKDGDTWLAFVEYEWVNVFSPDPSRYQKINKPWSGPEDGLPPVGMTVECQAVFPCAKDVTWAKVRVVHHDIPDFMPVKVAVVELKDPRGGFGLTYLFGEPENFRPIPTPDQQAAEKRETAIRELMDIAQVDCRVTAARLVDAGFKREVV